MTEGNSKIYNGIEVHDATEEECVEVFNSVCLHYMGITGEAFLKKWDEGTITAEDGCADHRIHRCLSVLPFVGRDKYPQ